MSTTLHASAAELVETVRRIAVEVAGPAAENVDREARFPAETFDALKKARILSANVPVELGGAGATNVELERMCEALGQRCASSAMILAMHFGQVAAICRHRGTGAFFKQYLLELVSQQRLVASSTSEAGVGGATRTSVCAVERAADGCKLRKDATVISYVESADDILITARRAPDAKPSDQVAVLVRKTQCRLEKTGTWDTLGMRGTASPAFIIDAVFPEEQVLPDSFAEISSKTLAPTAHILWSATWLGLATDALARARAFARTAAQKNPTVMSPLGPRLSEVSAVLQTFRAHVRDFAGHYDELLRSSDGGESELSSSGFTVQLVHLKTASSLQAVEVVTSAMRIAGIMAYKNDSPFSIGRHLRDAHSAALMMSNERMHVGSGPLHLYYRDEAL